MALLHKHRRRAVAIPTFVVMLLTQVVLLAPVSYAATFSVTNTADSGAGSLRQAIIDANATGGADTIDFTVGGTFSPASDYPAITEDLIIDGSSAPALITIDATGNSYGFQFTGGTGHEVNGLSISGSSVAGIYASAGATGLDIGGSTSTTVVNIDGSSNGIWLDGASNVNVNAARVGLVSGHSNNGILVQNASNVDIIGQGTEKNVFSGNTLHGIHIAGTSSNVQVQRTNIGTDFNGTVDTGNGSSGILIDATATSITIGGTSGNGNLISGNGGHGIDVSASGVTIQANTIGLDATQAVTMQNDGHGVYLNSASNLVGHASSSTDGNTISGNMLSGVYINSGDSNTIANNIIGTNGSSAAGLGNTQQGVELNAAGTILNTLIGTSGNGNLISGNGLNGILVPSNAHTGTQIVSNNIGLELDVTSPLGNGSAGVDITADSCVITNNIISANGDHGIWLNGADSCSVQTNRIGVANDGVTQVANTINGITIESGAASNLIGGSAISGTVNAIYSGGAAITVETSAGDFNTVDENQFVGMPGYAMIVKTDPSNESIATPVITSASTNTSEAHGTADPNATLEVYVDGAFIGNATADGLGAWSFYGALTGTQLNVYQTNTNGSSSSEATENPITADVTAPVTAPVMATATTITNTALQPIAGTKDAYTGVRLNGVEIYAPDSLTTWASTTTLVEGSNTLTFESTDYSGNISAANNIYNWELDTGAPSISSLSYPSSASNSTSSSSETFTGTVSEANAQIQVNGSTVTTADGAGNFSFTVSLNSGSNSINILAFDGVNYSSATLVSITRSGGGGAGVSSAVTAGGGSSSSSSTTADTTTEDTTTEDTTTEDTTTEDTTTEDTTTEDTTTEDTTTEDTTTQDTTTEDTTTEDTTTEDTTTEDTTTEDTTTEDTTTEDTTTEDTTTEDTASDPVFTGPETIEPIQIQPVIEFVPEIIEPDPLPLIEPVLNPELLPELNELFTEIKLDGETPNSEIDSDGDGLNDAEEAQYGTDSTSSDSDGDGVDDRVEIYELGTLPDEWDSDGDGIKDTDDNTPTQYTDIQAEQEDINVYVETFNELASSNTELSDQYTTPAGIRDSDKDGMSDWQELEVGTDPFSKDTDGDGLSDIDELSLYGSDPTKENTNTKHLDFGVSNYQSGDQVSPGEQLLMGSSGTDEEGLDVKVFMLVDGEPVLVGETQTDPEGRFGIATNEIESGEHQLYSVLEKDGEIVDVSKPFGLTVAQNEVVGTPELVPELLKDGDVINETRPTMKLYVGDVADGSTIRVVWQSLVLSQTFIKDEGQEFLEVTAYNDLEEGEVHTVSWDAKTYDDESGILLASSASQIEFEVQALQTAFIDTDTGGSSTRGIVIGGIIGLISLSGLAFFFKPRHPKGD